MGSAHSDNQRDGRHRRPQRHLRGHRSERLRDAYLGQPSHESAPTRIQGLLVVEELGAANSRSMMKKATHWYSSTGNPQRLADAVHVGRRP